MTLTPIGGGWVYDSTTNSMVYDPSAIPTDPAQSTTATTTTTSPYANTSIDLSWTSRTRHPKTPIPLQTELDVPGKTSVWNHRHLVRHTLQTVAAHRDPFHRIRE